MSAANFIAKHQSVLRAGNNMPASFGAVYAADAAAFTVKLQQFIDSEQRAYNDTIAKAAANNAVYAQLITMFKDGQEIFRKEDSIRRLFVFDSVLALLHHGALAASPQEPTDEQPRTA